LRDIVMGVGMERGGEGGGKEGGGGGHLHYGSEVLRSLYRKSCTIGTSREVHEHEAGQNGSCGVTYRGRGWLRASRAALPCVGDFL
jgi:hypothetical protein